MPRTAMTSVVVDGRALTDASRFRGIGTYVRNLLEAVAAVPGVSVSVLAQEGAPLPSGVAGVTVHRLPLRRSREFPGG